MRKMGEWLLLTALAFALTTAPAVADKLVIVAGGGSKRGEAAPATQAKLVTPFGIDFDRAGNAYIVELTGGYVHKIDKAGMLTTISGSGVKGEGGDGGPAAQASFNGMHDLA